LRFLLSEVRLIFGRRRNIAGLGVLAAVPIIIGLATKYSGEGGESGGFVGQATNNGLFVGLAALAVELPLFLPLAVAIIAGDAIAGEANTGTLRYLLAVPVQRTRLLAVKYAALLIGTIFAVLLVAVGLRVHGGLPGRVRGDWAVHLDADRAADRRHHRRRRVGHHQSDPGLAHPAIGHP
jgi:ABC-2 type transport system permease protein